MSSDLTTLNMPSKASETRKIRKPLMEKRRRARINHSLNELKRLLLDANSAKKEGARPAKLEKADILEMTVKHVQRLHDVQKAPGNVDDGGDGGSAISASDKFLAGFSECARMVEDLFVDDGGGADGLQQQERLLKHLQRRLQHLQRRREPDHTDKEPEEEKRTSRKTLPPTVMAPNTNNNSSGYALLPTKLPNGDLAFVIPAQHLRRMDQKRKGLVVVPSATMAQAPEAVHLHHQQQHPKEDKCGMQPCHENGDDVTVWRPW